MLHNGQMGELLGRALKSAREQRGYTQAFVADSLKVSRAAVGQWESGVTEPTTENLVNVCGLLQISLEAATGGLVKVLNIPTLSDPDVTFRSIEDRRPEMRDFESEVTRALSQRSPGNRGFPSDVPVFGVAVGGSDGEFYLNGEIVDYVRRPDGIRRSKEVYAIYVVGTSMVPRFEEGELVYVNPARPPSIGEYVVIQLKPADAAAPARALIKRLAKRGARIEVEQFNPPKTLRFEGDEILSMHRVIPWNELLGL
jgi:phage repressor protein C with HTH and peptisase S24 domain